MTRYEIRDNAPGAWNTCHIFDTVDSVIVGHYPSHFNAGFYLDDLNAVATPAQEDTMGQTYTGRCMACGQRLGQNSECANCRTFNEVNAPAQEDANRDESGEGSRHDYGMYCECPECAPAQEDTMGQYYSHSYQSRPCTHCAAQVHEYCTDCGRYVCDNCVGFHARAHAPYGDMNAPDAPSPEQVNITRTLTEREQDKNWRYSSPTPAQEDTMGQAHAEQQIEDAPFFQTCEHGVLLHDEAGCDDCNVWHSEMIDCRAKVTIAVIGGTGFIVEHKPKRAALLEVANMEKESYGADSPAYFQALRRAMNAT